VRGTVDDACPLDQAGDPHPAPDLEHRLLIGLRRQHGLQDRPTTGDQTEPVVVGSGLVVGQGRRGGVEWTERSAPGSQESVGHSREVLVAEVAESGKDAVWLAELGHTVSRPARPRPRGAVRRRCRIGLQHGHPAALTRQHRRQRETDDSCATHHDMPVVHHRSLRRPSTTRVGVEPRDEAHDP
jgi:hypothetical protein